MGSVRAADRSIAGRVALVTGAGRGLGAAILAELAAAGARVVAVDIDGDAASASAAAALATGREALPTSPDTGTARAFALDVRDRGAIASVVAAVAHDLGPVEILVNNAGVDRTAPFGDLTDDDWDAILGVNLRGAIDLTRAAWPGMVAAGRGHVVSIASTAAKRAWPNASAYHASKWGLLGFSHALHTEGRALGIAVTAIIAGGMRTPFLFDRFPDLDPDVLQEPANVARVVRFVLEAPAGTVVPEVLALPMRETSWP